ncbi:MAG: outer membrane protein assembly factor BamA [Thermodesulfovibrionales bacterium]|nr:outer membrane protein assembly factor BamA [Thermodesulfovibrionales bacterium]
MNILRNLFKSISSAFIILFFLLNFLTNSSSSEIAVKFPISNIEVIGLYSIKEEELLELLGLKRGDIIDFDSLKIGIKRAFLKGIFENLIIEGNQELSHIVVKVEEKRIIEKIEVLQNDFFSKGFILRNLKIEKGSRLNIKKIEEGISLLLEQIKKRGFTSANITYSIELEGRNKCVLVLNVQEGSPTFIQKIVVQPEPSETIKSLLDVSVGDIYDQLKIERMEENFINYFKKQGYIGVFIKNDFRDGILTINYSIGKRLEINIIGNEMVDTSTLMKIIDIREVNDLSDDLIDEIKTRLLLIYYQNGYAFADIIPIKTVNDDKIILSFYIFEGIKYTVDKIFLTGTSLQEDKIKKILNLKEGGIYNREYLDQDRNNIRELYHSLGYIEAEVYDPDVKLNGELIEIEFFIYEGLQVVVNEISVKNNQVFSNEHLLKEIPLKIGSPYNEIDIIDSRRKILEIYQKAGYINAKVSFETSFNGTKASVVFSVIEGNIFYFGKNIFIGNEKTRPEVIKRELQHEENKPLNYILTFKEKQQIQRLGLFRDVQIKLSDYTFDNKRDVLYYLEEENHGALESGFGYGEYEKYRFFIDLSHRNLWGMNRFGSIRTELSSLERRLSFIYTMPYFLINELTLKSMFLWESKREKSLDTKEILYRLRRNNFSIGIEKTFNRNIKSEVYYDFSVVKTSDVKPDIILSKEDVGTLIISGFRPGIIYDKRDNPFEPTEGFLLGFSSKLVSRVFFGEADFVKINLYGNKYFKLSEGIIFAISLRGGIARGFHKTQELPIVERFFLGGRTTVRGYAQDTLGPKGTDGNPTGGNAFLMGNFELRAYTKKGFGLVGFIDAGEVWQRINQIKIFDLKFTTGIGIRYKTPAGPLRIDYGHKLNRVSGESKGEIHFSIGHAF